MHSLICLFKIIFKFLQKLTFLSRLLQIFSMLYNTSLSLSYTQQFLCPLSPSWTSQVAQWYPLVNAGDDTVDQGSIPGSGRSPGVGKGNPLQ